MIFFFSWAKLFLVYRCLIVTFLQSFVCPADMLVSGGSGNRFKIEKYCCLLLMFLKIVCDHIWRTKLPFPNIRGGGNISSLIQPIVNHIPPIIKSYHLRYDFRVYISTSSRRFDDSCSHYCVSRERGKKLSILTFPP